MDKGNEMKGEGLGHGDDGNDRLIEERKINEKLYIIGRKNDGRRVDG